VFLLKQVEFSLQIRGFRVPKDPVSGLGIAFGHIMVLQIAVLPELFVEAGIFHLRAMIRANSLPAESNHENAKNEDSAFESGFGREGPKIKTEVAKHQIGYVPRLLCLGKTYANSAVCGRERKQQGVA
jgi:hypothetical protein